MKTITFTGNGKVKIEEPTVLFHDTLDKLQGEVAYINERIGDFDQQIAELDGERQKLIAERDEKLALIESVTTKAEVEKVDLSGAVAVEEVVQ